MKTMLIEYLKITFERAEWYARTYKEVEVHQHQAFGAVQFFNYLDESFDVSGEDRAYINRLWETYRHKYWELMKEKV